MNLPIKRTAIRDYFLPTENPQADQSIGLLYGVFHYNKSKPAQSSFHRLNQNDETIFIYPASLYIKAFRKLKKNPDAFSQPLLWSVYPRTLDRRLLVEDPTLPKLSLTLKCPQQNVPSGTEGKFVVRGELIFHGGKKSKFGVIRVKRSEGGYSKVIVKNLASDKRVGKGDLIEVICHLDDNTLRAVKFDVLKTKEN